MTDLLKSSKRPDMQARRHIALMKPSLKCFGATSLSLMTGCKSLTKRDPSEDFFSPDRGGDPAMFQHVFWFFGHPEAFIPFILLSLAVIAIIIALFFPKFGRAILNIFKWPPGVPALWFYGGAGIAIFGIVSGFKMANEGVDVVLHDTYYLVAHAQYVFGVCIMSGVAAVIFLALPHILRAEYNIWLGRLCWALCFTGIGFILFPQYVLSNQGMPRRYVDYEETYKVLNDLSLIGAVLCALSIATFAVLVIEALVKRRPLRDKPANPALDAFE